MPGKCRLSLLCRHVTNNGTNGAAFIEGGRRSRETQTAFEEELAVRPGLAVEQRLSRYARAASVRLL